MYEQECKLCKRERAKVLKDGVKRQKAVAVVAAKTKKLWLVAMRQGIGKAAKGRCSGGLRPQPERGQRVVVMRRRYLQGLRVHGDSRQTCTRDGETRIDIILACSPL